MAKRTLRQFMEESIVIARWQYMLNFLMGMFAGTILMFAFSMLGLV